MSRNVLHQQVFSSLLRDSSIYFRCYTTVSFIVQKLIFFIVL